MTSLLIRPIITEKSMQEAAKSRFTFAVDEKSNKAEIAEAVVETFKVKPTAVQTVTVKGKSKRVGKRRMERISRPWKKAIVTLEKAQKIDLFDVTEQQEGRKAG